MNKLKNYLYFLLLVLHINAFAQYATGTGDDLTAASENVNKLLVIAVQLLVIGLFALGFGFICVSFTKYKKHKKLPTFVPLQTVVLMFLGGVIFIILGIVYIYTGREIFGPDYMSLLNPGEQKI